MKGNSIQHLSTVLQWIKDEKHFGIVRPADGEFYVLSNRTLTNIDNWTFTSGSILQNDLVTSLKMKNPNVYIGIPCPHCTLHSDSLYDKYIKLLELDHSRKTYANLFCNSNWNTFIQFMKNYSKGIHVITSGNRNPTEFNVVDRFLIDTYLVNKWDQNKDDVTTRLFSWVSTKNNEVFCFCAGPLSKVWIPILYEKYPNNTYLDVGSALDIFLKGETNRGYALGQSTYSDSVCDFTIR
jgi:hypothetical protein